MFVISNLLSDFHRYFRARLSEMYDLREADNIFFLVARSSFGFVKSDILTADLRLSESELLRFQSLLTRLETGEPVQYVLGETEFCECVIRTSPDVLIPRPETEELAWMAIKSNRHIKSAFQIADLCTGSGCLAIALARHLSMANVFASDISLRAIETAEKSANLNGVVVRFKQVDIFSGDQLEMPESDLIISNPPYIPQGELNSLHKNVREFEPHQALFVSDQNPLKFYSRIAALCKIRLKTGGQLYLELNPDFSKQIELLFTAAKFETTLVPDMQGQERFLMAKKRGA